MKGKWYVCWGVVHAKMGLSPGCLVIAHRKCLKMQMRMERWREVPKGAGGHGQGEERVLEGGPLVLTEGTGRDVMGSGQSVIREQDMGRC